jgi:hypothetical protein
MKREIRLIAICSIKLITSKEYSPTTEPLLFAAAVNNRLVSRRANGKPHQSGLDKEHVITADMFFKLFHVICLWAILTGKMYVTMK